MHEGMRITPRTAVPVSKHKEKATGKQGPSFSQILKETAGRAAEVRFSAHALERIKQRELPFQAGDMARLEEAVEKARGKGIKSSLIIYRDMAFIASVSNSTIVTAVDKKAMKEHVFMGIDGAVFIEE